MLRSLSDLYSAKLKIRQQTYVQLPEDGCLTPFLGNVT